MKKRQFLKQTALATGGLVIGAPAIASVLNQESAATTNDYELGALGCAYNALEPYIDAQTMEIHYSKHHQAYVANLNKAVAGTEAASRTVEELCKSISKYPTAVRNNAGGHYNHTMFWSILKVNNGSLPSGVLTDAIQKDFGSVTAFKEAFAKAALGRFGSGWVWLIVTNKGSLQITSTPNQDNPIMDVVPAEEAGIPILALDVWEHAYYLKYQNKRADYITAFWSVVNWDAVLDRYQKALK